MDRNPFMESVPYIFIKKRATARRDFALPSVVRIIIPRPVRFAIPIDPCRGGFANNRDRRINYQFSPFSRLGKERKGGRDVLYRTICKPIAR